MKTWSDKSRKVFHAALMAPLIAPLPVGILFFYIAGSYISITAFIPASVGLLFVAYIYTVLYLVPVYLLIEGANGRNNLSLASFLFFASLGPYFHHKFHKESTDFIVFEVAAISVALCFWLLTKPTNKTLHPTDSDADNPRR